MAHRVLQVVVVVGLAHFAFAGFAQGLDIGAERQEGLCQASGLYRDAEPGGHRAVGVPEGIE